jgi:alkylated DNA repair dioxygenase AlkB
VVSFGWRYDFNGPGLVEAEPMPAWLLPVRDRAAAFAALPPEAFAHVLINEYREGAPIGWHKDRPAFEKVVGVSLGAPCVMRLRRRVGERFERKNVPLDKRSAYLLDGEARAAWEHSIPEAQALRYSITFRNLRAVG